MMDEDKNQGQFAERLRPDTTRQQRADYMKSYREAKGGNYRVIGGPGAENGQKFRDREITAERQSKVFGRSYQPDNLQKISGPNINGSEAHMVRDTASGKMMDFKFKDVAKQSKQQKAASAAKNEKAAEAKNQAQGKGPALSKQNSRAQSAQTQKPAQAHQKRSALVKKQGENKQVAEQKGKSAEPKAQAQGKGSALSKQNSQPKPAQTQQPAQTRQNTPAQSQQKKR